MIRPLLAGVVFAGLSTLVIGLTASGLSGFETIGPGAPFAYPWRLVEPTTLGAVTAWLGYALHNLAAWGVIWAARRERPAWDTRLRRWNWWMVGVHALFVPLHIVQSQVAYDGLARDVPEITALGSVALMLMVVLILEAPRRGLILGWKPNWPQGFLRVVREYHGYLFTWALIYTFWYHPTEGTAGHLVGFFYLLLLLWQSVLLFHRAHRDRRWTLFLELLVIPHGVAVAVLQGQGLWPMFLWGFGSIFLLTQVYGLGLTTPRRRALVAAGVVAMVGTYAATGRLAEAHEVTRIPVLDYGVVALLVGIYVGARRLHTAIRG